MALLAMKVVAFDCPNFYISSLYVFFGLMGRVAKERITLGNQVVKYTSKRPYIDFGRQFIALVILKNLRC
jgi:hypothetical protein